MSTVTSIIRILPRTMSNKTDFFQETLSATHEILGGSPGAWGTKMITGVIMALAQSVEAATIAIAVFLVLCILDAILGVMRQVKINMQPGSVNVPNQGMACHIRACLEMACRWYRAAGGIVLRQRDVRCRCLDGWSCAEVLTGIVLGAIIIEVAAKADYLQRWGIADKLKRRFPELFGE